ncbi:hypothetical protein Ddye_024925 [Dipteronia dyeriana]|uniref:Uncharacterized protein n=1 Tax=Dipteronia dyeriana TaxID=168575 RepID=A0AAD9TVY3_9ROSI|nr:hypothetical protein Ddye_024925 [Dipteronia dyeriana]
MMKMVQEDQEIRKGPWTEPEDILLINFVHLFGDRRWDFIAKVSGLNRTGKSCRLRWVNYLHPGLKRGKMTSQEERLVLELHNKWGNRWSRIARKLPGRTDNEIKNYWRTHMRKKAQERKKGVSDSPSNSLSSNSESSSSTVTTGDSFHFCKTGTRSFYDTGGSSDDHAVAAAAAVVAFPGSNIDDNHQGLEGYDEKGFYSMDDIWNDIDLSEEKNMMIKPVCPPIPSPSWEDCFWDDSLWKMDEFEESKNMILPQIEEYGIGKANLTGLLVII